MSKSHPEQWTIREVAERPETSLVTALREFATTQIADCGGPVGVMGPPLRHLAGGPELCGPAVTVWTKPGDILYVLKATDLIAAGDVLVVDGGGRPDAAVIGDIAGQALADLGCNGLVVDGAVRDLDGLDAAGLPTFAAGAHPATGSNQGPGAINVVVQVRRGDRPSRGCGPRRRQRPRRRAEGTPRGGARHDQGGRRPGKPLAAGHRRRRHPARRHRHRRPDQQARRRPGQVTRGVSAQRGWDMRNATGPGGGRAPTGRAAGSIGRQ